MRIGSRPLSLAVLGLVVLAGGCKKKEPPPAPVVVQPAPPPPVAVAGIEMGRAIGADKAVAAATTVFGTRDTIYASIGTTGVSQASTLTAKWTFQTGQTVDSSSVSIAPTGPATTEFHITKKSAWPVGKYKVAIQLDGQPAGEREFEVKK